MPHIYRPEWEADEAECVQKWSILDATTSCEGLSLARYRWNKSRSIEVANYGCIISVFKGSGFIHLVDSNGQKGQLFLSTFVHAYIPPCNVRFQGVENGTEIACLSAPTTALAQGKELIIRNEEIMANKFSKSGMSRWTKVELYTSRRLFLHHDKTLISKNGHPISWNRTSFSTDTDILLKLSYNNHTEFNMIYDLDGDVRVRTAMHPYPREIWSEWHMLDGSCCYYLDETEPMAEQQLDIFGRAANLRNKHELHFSKGHCSLFCMFDPGLAGTETHDTGSFSAYDKFSDIQNSEKYRQFLDDVLKTDAIADTESLRKAQEDAKRHIYESTLV